VVGLDPHFAAHGGSITYLYCYRSDDGITTHHYNKYDYTAYISPMMVYSPPTIEMRRLRMVMVQESMYRVTSNKENWLCEKPAKKSAVGILPKRIASILM